MKSPFAKNLKLQRKLFTKSIFPQNVIVSEFITQHVLQSIIKNSENVIYTDNHPQSKLYKSIHDQLKKYAERYNEDEECFKVPLTLPKHCWGRLNPAEQLGLSVFHRKHRHSLALDFYDDYDMINAEPEIFYQILKMNHINYGSLTYYCENREKILEELVAHYHIPTKDSELQITREDFKKAIIAFMNGGELSTFVKEHKLEGIDKHHDFILQFSTEMLDIIDLIYSHNEHIGESCVKADPSKFKNLSVVELLKQKKRTTVSLYYQTVERFIQEIAIDYLVKTKGFNLLEDFVPSQDGFMLRKHLSYPALIDDINNAVLQKVGFKIPFKHKPFDEAFKFDLIPDFKPSIMNVEDIARLNENITNIKKIEQISNGSSDYDLAKLIAEKYGENYVCACIKNNIWFEFKEHRWVQLQCASSLYLLIPEQFRTFIRGEVDKVNKLREELTSDEMDKGKKLSGICQRLCEIAARLGRTNDQKNIMTQLKNILFQPKFFEKLDPPYLLCCKNGVIDFRTKTFRDGKKDDYCSKSTGIDYITTDEAINPKNHEDMCVFLEQLFPFKEQRIYVIEHLASVLIGNCKHQEMYHYLGVGSNGKTQLIKLMGFILGEYYGTMPTALLCEKIGKIGSVSPEIAELKGKRLVIMNEPSKGDIMLEGNMKRMTGGDPLKGRALYQDSVEFIPQFVLGSVQNELLKIKATDNGTWRRIRVITFSSQFLDPKSEEYDKTNELHFPKDKHLDDKLKRITETFLRKLVQTAFQTNGDISDCAMVNNDSRNYFLSQDRVGMFIEENLIKDPEEQISRTMVGQIADAWNEENYKYKIPNKELYARLDKTYSCSKSGMYKGFTLKSCLNNEDEIELSNEDVFTNEFVKCYEITGDKNDFIPSINISGWAKINNLKITTSMAINSLLLTLGLDVKNKEHYKYKKIEGKSVNCWIGLKLIANDSVEPPLENKVIADDTEEDIE
jgi:P4 family phage/plasmid primase-like protien